MASSRPGGHGGQQGGGHHDHDLSEEERQKLKAKVLGVIKAILMAATKAGIHVEKFNREYRVIFREWFPTIDGYIFQANTGTSRGETFPTVD